MAREVWVSELYSCDVNCCGHFDDICTSKLLSYLKWEVSKLDDLCFHKAFHAIGLVHTKIFYGTTSNQCLRVGIHRRPRKACLMADWQT